MRLIDTALKLIEGYCYKHPDCKNCRLCDDAGLCILSDLPPCDWSERIRTVRQVKRDNEKKE